MTATDTEREAALQQFHRWSHYLHLAEYGYDNSAVKRLDGALAAVRKWRRLSNTGNGSREEIVLAVRVVAEALANEVQSSAGPEQDAATVAWVVAGLLCPAQPFCVGCSSCQTVTSPLRPAEPARRRWL